MSRSAKSPPPYLSYKTLRNFLDSLRTAMPSRIDRSLMPSKSGSNQVLLVSALKYLRLITDNGLPTTELQQLVKADGSDRQRVWRNVIVRAYSEVLESGIDIERTTTQELSEAFVREGVSSPDTIKKCVTFLSLAAKDAGLKLSPHIKPYAGKRRPVLGKATVGRSYLMSGEPSQNGAAISEALLRKFPNFDPSWPEEERDNWLAAFEKLTKITYASANGANPNGETHDEVHESILVK